jgi:hypothetical protein
MTNFQFYLEKLTSSKEFSNFKKEFPDVFFTSGFFSLDKEKEGEDKFHLDFFVPSFKRLFSFKLEKGVERIPLEIIEGQEFVKISDNYDFTFEELEEIILEKMKQEKVDKKVQKIIYSLQGKEGKEILISTVFISGFSILKIVFDIREKKIIEFEKKSFMDFLRIGQNKKKD